MSLLTKTMNFISKPNLSNKLSNESSQPKIQSGPLVPSLIEVVSTSLKTNQSAKNTQFQPANSQTVQNQSESKKMTQTSQKESPKTIFLSRKNIAEKTTISQQINQQIGKQVEESLKKDGSLENYVDCQISIQDESNTYLGNPISRQISILPDELEDLILFIEQVEERRRTQEKQGQEKRSADIAKKIASQKLGIQFLRESSILSDDGGETWNQIISISGQNGDEEIAQVLNFQNPQHSWILETWLSQQAVSWTIKRYSPTPEQIIYQVSFGFPDQTFLEAEGPSREGSILAVAEDLLS